jgi:hypothetical protein
MAGPPKPKRTNNEEKERPLPATPVRLAFGKKSAAFWAGGTYYGVAKSEHLRETFRKTQGFQRGVKLRY